VDRSSYKAIRAADVTVLALAASVAALEGDAFRWEVALGLIVTATTLWLVAGRALHQYDPGNGRGFFDDIALTLIMVALSTLPVVALAIAVPRYVNAESTGRFLIVLVPAILLLRLRGPGMQLLRRRPTVQVIVAGIGPLGRITGRELGEGDPSRRLLGYLNFDDETLQNELREPLLGSVSDLELALREKPIGEVYFASTANAHSAQVQAGIRACEKLGVPFALPVCSYRLTRARSTTPAHDGYLHFSSVQVKPAQHALKRGFDILSSGVALVLLSPLLIGAAIAVKVTSKGAVLFRQVRVGVHGRKFHMLKFRSMVADAEALKAALMTSNEQSGPVFKMTRDPRVTNVGRFMRKYSIDELPQLVNVLRGDMSVVGPRPPLPSEVAKYEGWQYRRLSVRPGLTCIWQVSGRNQISFEEWMLLDMRYIDHWGLAGDFTLILKTIPVVLLGRGAS
jgi:exopolysaccharide biosynthesis polyprenyl glycosylphosphotransferase